MARASYLANLDDDGALLDDAPKFYYIDTDDTCPAFLSDGCEFDYLYYENGGNVYPYPAFEWNGVALAVKDAYDRHKGGDFIVLDRVNDVYEYACTKIADMRGINITDTAVARQMGERKQGFGAFTPDDWVNARRVFNSVADLILKHSDAHAIFTCAIKEIIPVAGRERQDVLLTFDNLGFKPDGAPRLPAMMETICFLWAARKMPKDERGKSTGANYTARYITLLKDRGVTGDIVTENYDKDFHLGLQELRRKERERRAKLDENHVSPNVLGKNAAKLVKEKLEEISARAYDQTGVDEVDNTDTEVQSTEGDMDAATGESDTTDSE